MRQALGIIFAVVFMDLVGFGIVIPILPYYAKDYGATAFELGLLMTSYSLMQFIFAPIWGRLSDRIGRRPVLVASIIGQSLSFLILAFSPSLLWLFLGRSFAGVCGANISTATAYIADVTRPEDRARGMGIIGAGFGLGFIVGPALGGILSKYGYNVPMIVAACLSAINAVFAYARLKEPELNIALREKNRARKFTGDAFKLVFSSNKSRSATLLFFFTTLAVTQMEVVFALFMLTRFGFQAQSAGWLLAYMGIIMVIIQGGLIGRLSKRFGEVRLILLGALLMTGGLASITLSYSLMPLLLALGIMALGHGFMNPSLSSLCSKGSSQENYGITMGIYQSAGSLARVLGPPSAGYLFDHFAPQMPLIVASSITLIVAITMVSLSRRYSELSLTAHQPVDLNIKPESKLIKMARVLREKGFKGFVQVYGWKVVIAFFAYYLVRDITLYIAIPWLAARGIFNLSIK